MDSYLALLNKVQKIRRRLRFEMICKGLGSFILFATVTLVLSIWGLEKLGFGPASIWSIRLLSLAAIVGMGATLIIAPLQRRISDVQLAQLVEERYPQLEDRLVTSIEYGKTQRQDTGILRLLHRDALSRAGKLDFGVFLNRRKLALYGATGAGALMAFLMLLWWGPSFFPYGFSRLYAPWSEADGNAILGLRVTPGDCELARGLDQLITAQLIGFDSPDVSLFLQSEVATGWANVPMEHERRSGGFIYLLIDLQSSTQYYVQSKGVRSPTYRLKVVDLARVDKINLTYHFPNYTGMAPQSVEGEGDISALKGTRVELSLHLSQRARSARLVFDDQSALPLPAKDGQTFAGSLDLRRSGSYVVEITGDEGKVHAGSPEYRVEALEDQPPKVAVTKPLRDLRATNVEEVFSEFKAEDDLGVAKVEVRFSVNGSEERSLTIHSGKTASKNVTASYTFFLEEFNLQPGDLISYYGRATDNNNITGPGIASSDIYFIQVRPFDQKVVQNQRGGGPGGGGGEGQESLSRQQKEIISATFRLLRDKDKTAPKEYTDDLKSLALVQSRLQAQAQGLVDRLKRRGAIEIGDQFAKLSEYLKNALVEMGSAATELGAQKPAVALAPEQKALQQLMRAESLFREIQVSFGAAGGGARGSQANAEDLADLFELELNKLKNQYEMIQRGEQQARDEKVDEALERLKELAQRQQQIIERNRMLGRRGGSSSSAGDSRSQQQLAEEAEELQRQLQRLSRERSSPELDRVGSRLQQALQEMKRALDQSQQGRSQEATAQGIRALQQLEEAQRALSLSRSTRLKNAIEQAIAESGKLLGEQEHIQQGVNQLAGEKARDATQDSQQMRSELSERKALLADRIRNLGERLNALAREARKTQKDTSGRLNDASDIIRDRRLPEVVLGTRPLLENGIYPILRSREEAIRKSLEEIQKQVQAANSSLGQPSEAKLENALQRARDLAQALESMQQKLGRNLRESGNQAASQRAQPPQQGRQGAEAQRDREAQGDPQAAQAAAPGQSQGQPGPAPSGESPRQTQQNGRGGSPSPSGTVTDNSDGFGPPIGVGRPGNEATRQWNRELSQRLMDANELRSLLDRNPTLGRNLDQVLDRLKRMESSLNAMSAEGLVRLKQAIDLLRQVEQDISRDLDRLTEKEKYFYAEDQEAPAGYKQLVEEYYRALARIGPE